MLDSDRKLAWAIILSLGCHVFILFLAAEYAPWRILKAGKQSQIVVQLNDLQSGQAATGKQGKQNEREPEMAPEPLAAVREVPASKKDKKRHDEADPKTLQAPAEEHSGPPLNLDSKIEETSAAPHNAGAGSWHADYARELRRIIKKNQRYPIMAVRNRLQGTVMVGFILSRSGRLIECHITKSCPHTILDRAALRAVESVEQFPPFPETVPWEQAGFVVPVTFRLEQ